MNPPGEEPKTTTPTRPTWPQNLGIGLLAGIILGMLIASWGLRQENWQEAGFPTVGTVMFVIVVTIVAVVSCGVGLVRNGFRCSRRALVITIAVFAVLLLGLEHFLEPTRAQRASAAKLKAAGAAIVYTHNHDCGIKTLLGEEYFEDVRHVTWHFKNGSNPDLSYLEGMNRLQSLQLLGLKRPPSNLESLKASPQLTHLSFVGCQITEQSLECIGQIHHLTALLFSGTPVTNSALKTISQLTQLRILSFCNVPGEVFTGKYITDQGLEQLVGLTKLQQPDLPFSKTTYDGREFLQQSLPSCKVYFIPNP
jgi:hypothetical protein